MSSIQTQVGETSPVIAAESPSAIVSDARAAEIRAALTAEHGAVWMHYYHRAIENEVVRILQANIDSPPDKNSFVAPDGTLLVAKPNRGCVGCVFFNRTGEHVHGTVCGDAPACSDDDRTDKRSIIWVKA